MRYLRTFLLSTAVILVLVTAGCMVAQTGNTTDNSSTVTPQTVVPASTTAAGAAGTSCSSGMIACSDGYCHDTTSDHDACGGCGNVCPAADICSSSVCLAPATQGTTTSATTAPTVTTTTVPAVTTTVATIQTLSKISGLIIVTVAPTPGEVGDGCSYLPANQPYSLTSISPTSGAVAGGTTVTITGTGFQNAVMSVYFGNTKIRGFSNSNDGTTIWVTSPKASSAGTVDVRVVGVGAGILGDSSSCATSVTSADRFTYTA